MNKVFLKQDQVNLINGGYLTNGETPIYNEKFVNAQIHAEYVITFAAMAKDKDFVGKEVDSLDKFKNEVLETLYSKKVKEHVKGPKKPENTLHEKLKSEALDFIKFQEGTSNAEKVNNFLSKFDVIAEFEEFGLFFEQDIVKLNKIYTMKEIVKAVESVINLLD